MASTAIAGRADQLHDHDANSGHQQQMAQMPSVPAGIVSDMGCSATGALICRAEVSTGRHLAPRHAAVGVVTVVVDADIDPAILGLVVNSATVTDLSGRRHVRQRHGSDSVRDAVADLSITKTDGLVTALPAAR